VNDERFVPIASEDQVNEGDLLGIDVGEVPVLFTRLNGRIHALGRICTHEYADLADGEIEEGSVVCPLHGSKFDILTGAALTLPAIDAEPVYDVKVEDGVVYVAVPPQDED